MPRLVVITTTELGPGFRMAGVRTRAAGDGDEAVAMLREEMQHQETAVIALHAPYFDALDARERGVVDASLRPVVVALPPGDVVETADQRRAELAERLRRAVGYHITVHGEDA